MRVNLTPIQIARFWSRFDRTNGCWLWRGGETSRDGYGRFSINNAHWPAHRLSYFLTYGDFPDELLVCHNCDEAYPVGDITYRLCGRPDHLWLGTQAQNTADRDKKGRTATGDRAGSRTHPETLIRGAKHWQVLHPERRNRGEDHARHRLTELQVREIRRASATETKAELARRYGVSDVSIGRIMNNQAWTHLLDSEGAR